MVKQWLSVLLCLALALSLAACGGAVQVPGPAPSAPVSAQPSPAAPADDPDSGPELPGAELPSSSQSEEDLLNEDGTYDSKDDVALYLHQYGCLPDNYITKKQAQALGWPGGSLEPYAPGKCIGGSAFGNREGLLPAANGRTWSECDIDTLGANSRGSKRIVYSNDGYIYYTNDHYESFQLLYEPDA